MGLMKKTGIIGAVLFIHLILSGAASAGTGIRIVLTSNLSGAFSPFAEDQEKKDPVILTGQSVITEKKKGADIYIDLGNAFYPGVIAKYSFGSAMMDFFTYTGCALTLVSSSDLMIGVNSLEFLQKGSRTRLVSGNLLQKGRNIFLPYHPVSIKKRKIAFIGLSSRKIFVDIAEKNLFDVEFGDEIKILEKTLNDIKGAGIEYVILLSGLDDKSNLKILRKFKEIDLVIGGADRSRGIFDEMIVRMDTADSRSLISAFRGSGYYLLDLDIEKKITVNNYRFIRSVYHRIESKKYREFISRITRWKKHYQEKTGEIITVARGRIIRLNAALVSHLMREVFNTEISLLRKGAVTSFLGADSVTESSILSSINDIYPVFIFELRGSEIQTVKSFLERMISTGYKEGKVQGLDIAPERNYRISATQPVFEMIEKKLGRRIEYTNTWKNLTEIVVEDLKGERVLLRDDFSYLDRRLRLTVDILLSNFFQKSTIRNRDRIKAPPGQSEKSYERWGVEDRIDFTLYNRYHTFLFTPYIHYVKEGEKYIDNLLRGTFLYSLNPGWLVHPYHKSQLDSVVSRDEDRRPAVIRETVGGNIVSGFLTGKIGFGFEKHVHDEVEPAVYGFEAILALKYDFLTYLSYSLSLDSFVSFTPSKKITRDQGYIRGEIENRLSFKVTTLINLSLKHKYYHYYLLEDKMKFTESLFVTSLDLKTDFKFF